MARGGVGSSAHRTRCFIFLQLRCHVSARTSQSHDNPSPRQREHPPEKQILGSNDGSPAKSNLTSPPSCSPRLIVKLKVFVVQEFSLCEQWVELHPACEQLQLKTEHLLFLLENGQTDEAFQVPPASSGPGSLHAGIKRFVGLGTRR